MRRFRAFGTCRRRVTIRWVGGASAPGFWVPRRLILLWGCLTLLLAQPLRAGAPQEDTGGDVDQLHITYPEGMPKGLLLYLTGTPRWEAVNERRARVLADEGYLVAGIAADTLPPPEGPGACWDLGGDLRALAQRLGEGHQIPADSLPVLLGEGSGGSLVYAALVQSPAHSFHAALTLGFCPTLPVDARLCPVGSPPRPLVRDGRLEPAARVETTWFALTTDRDAACPEDGAAAFVARVENARLVAPQGGSGAGDLTTRAQDGLGQVGVLLQWLDPRIHGQLVAGGAQEAIAGLPLTEVRASQGSGSTLALMLSGDGGWAALDRGVAAGLAAHGIDTLGWDSLAYYWKFRTPEEASGDLERVLRHYLDAWDKARVVLIGYSFGADVLPFLFNRLPPDLRSGVDLVALLGAGPAATFEFHLSDWLSSSPSGMTRPVLPELRRLSPTPLLCVYGADEKESICPGLTGDGVLVRGLPGDHHFGGDYGGLADLILQVLRGAGP